MKGRVRGAVVPWLLGRGETTHKQFQTSQFTPLSFVSFRNFHYWSSCVAVDTKGAGRIRPGWLPPNRAFPHWDVFALLRCVVLLKICSLHCAEHFCATFFSWCRESFPECAAQCCSLQNVLQKCLRSAEILYAWDGTQFAFSLLFCFCKNAACWRPSSLNLPRNLLFASVSHFPVPSAYDWNVCCKKGWFFKSTVRLFWRTCSHWAYFVVPLIHVPFTFLGFQSMIFFFLQSVFPQNLYNISGFCSFFIPFFDDID